MRDRPAARHFRVDARLVHTTTLSTWVPAVGARVILVVDGEIEPKRRSILELSAMGELPIRFTSERRAHQVLSSCEATDPVLVLFPSLESAAGARDAGLEFARLIVGHLPEAPERSPIHPAVHLGPSDLEIIEELVEGGVEVLVQPLPSDKAIRLPLAPQHRAPSSEVPPLVATQKVTDRLWVRNARGLHLRAAHTLAELSAARRAEVHIALDTDRVNAKSLLGLATLGAACGTLLTVEVEGDDAEETMVEIRALFASGFEEGVDWSPPVDEMG